MNGGVFFESVLSKNCIFVLAGVLVYGWMATYGWMDGWMAG